MKNNKLSLTDLKVQSFITSSNANNIGTLKGGANEASDGPTICQVCPVPPINLPTIDIPTFNDSCFTLCRDKCNDF